MISQPIVLATVCLLGPVAAPQAPCAFEGEAFQALPPSVDGAPPGEAVQLEARAPRHRAAPGSRRVRGFAADTIPPPSPPHPRVISVNPVAFLAFGFFSVDYEQVLTGNTSAGGAASYFRRGNAHFFTVDGRARYYFHGTVLDGFSVGVLGGLVSRRDRVEDTSTTGLGLGFVLEHQWLLGDDRRLALTAGGGAQRLIYFGDRPGRSVLPVIRLSMGWVF